MIETLLETAGSILLLQSLQAPLMSEFAATLLQIVITCGLAALCANLFGRYKRPWFGWFAVAWGLYVARLICILSFIITENRDWLYWHQVTTGWTALALLWGSLVFLRQPVARAWYVLLALFPPVWSFIAIYRLDSFLWAALPAVSFLSAATLWTGLVFWRHHRAVGSPGARTLAIAFAAWGLHHLDYPFLRAQGAWTPWGYYLDICFELLVGAGLVLLVLDDLGRGVRALSALSGDLQRRRIGGDPLDLLLSRPLTLSGVSGSAMYYFKDDSRSHEGNNSTSQHHSSSTDNDAISERYSGPPVNVAEFVRGSGSCTSWAGSQAEGAVADLLSRMRQSRQPQVVSAGGGQPFLAALPVSAGTRLIGALVMAGEVRNPFTALDDDFLLALGQQVGAAIEQSALDEQLANRTQALEKLSTQMVRQHEEERRRLSRELHDETAQVFSAVKMQLEALRTLLPQQSHSRLDRTLSLVDTGIRSIRQVTSDLRPSLLDDLGLLPALRSLVRDFSDRTGLRASLHAPDSIPHLADEGELALFRALQEALSNVARHAEAEAVAVTVTASQRELQILVRDDGRGFDTASDGSIVEPLGRMGLAGMRERLHDLRGQVVVGNHDAGAEVRITLPVNDLDMVSI